MSDESGKFVHVANLSDFDSVPCITAQAGGHTLALFKYGDSIYAIDNRCPHMGFPLSQGSVTDGILTCYWHYARFDLATGGTFDQFADDVPTFPVELRDGGVWVDLSPQGDRSDYYRTRLNDGLERDIPLVIAKAVIHLLEAGADPVESFRIGLAYGTTYRGDGWGQGLTILTCMQNLLPYLRPDERARALYHGLAAVTRDTTGEAPRFVVSPLPGEAADPVTLKRWFRQFVEVRDSEGAERCLVSASRAGAGRADLADMLFAAATDHRYIQVGHPLDFTNKALEALDHTGWEDPERILTSLVGGIAFAQRMEESNAWRHPVDLVAILAGAFERLPDSLEGAGDGWVWEDSLAMVDTLLGDDPHAIADALLGALAAGCTPVDLAQAVSYAAAMRIARFHTSNEFTDWDTALHTFTFANAVEMGLRRLHAGGEDRRYTDLLRGVFDAAMSVYLDRFLNVPATRIPVPNGSPDGAALSELPRLLDRQQQVNPAAQAVADYLGNETGVDELLAELGRLLLREDRDFHTIQTVDAALNQFRLLAGKPEAVHARGERSRTILIAAVRYLAAHSPTVRAQGQTYQIALRLARGERLYEG